MCNPILGVSAALQAASVLANNRAAKKVEQERNRVLEANRLRQSQFAQEADVNNTSTQDQFTAENQATKRQANIDTAIKDQAGISANGDYLADSQTAPSVVKSEIARQLADAVSRGKGYGTSSANINSYGQTSFDNNLALTRNAEEIERINNFSRGETAVVPLALQNANTKGQGSRNLADLFGAAGDIGMAYGFGKMGGGSGVRADAGAPVIDKSFNTRYTGAPNSYSGNFFA